MEIAVRSSRASSALLVIDVQNDFCEGGALPVPHASQVVSALNRHLTEVRARGWRVYASRDWHPPVTQHFQQSGGPWPPHCIQNTRGAEFHHALRLPPTTVVVSKGQSPEDHGYSAFEGTTLEGAPLSDALQAAGIDHVYVGGLATDYCVRQSARDALRLGFKVTLLTDAMAGINRQPDDSRKAIDELAAAGAHLQA